MTQVIKQDMERVITDSISHLQKLQAQDGSFLGNASADSVNFSNPKTHPTAFFTSLIVSCLQEIPEASAINAAAIKFILSARSKNGSWNYWLPGSRDAKTRPYPDDFDDTACALAAIAADDASRIEGEMLGTFARQLISQESAIGGPYTTWLIDATADEQWKDIDIAVNANIGYVLAARDALPEGLMTYITNAIRNESVESKYYFTAIPVLYFISRWYKGEAEPELADLIIKAVKKLDLDNPLHISMLISSCCRLGLQRDAQLLVGILLKQKQGPGWKACTLYYEPPINGVLQYAGSESLTTAFALEAIQTYFKSDAPSETKEIVDNVKPASFSVEGLESNFAKRYTEILNQLLAKDSAGMIARIASITEQSTGRSCAKTSTVLLNRASLHGWASYTIFDDILDEDSSAALLPMATFMLRRTVSDFQAAVPASTGFHAYVAATLDVVDQANAWEMECARFKNIDDVLTIHKLPVYGGLDQLRNRSLGHILASTAVLLLQGYKLKSINHRRMTEFFKHYLIARQLNDDAHDWILDLKRGQLNYVVTNLLASYFNKSDNIRIDFSDVKSMQRMKVYYWTNIIPSVVNEIKQNVLLAHKNLDACTAIADKRYFKKCLSQLEKSAQAAMKKRDETKSFIAGFTDDRQQ